QRDTYCCTGTLGTTIKSYPSSWYAFDWGGTRLYILDGAWGDSTGAYLGDRQAHFNGPVAGCPICGAELTWLTNDLTSHPAAHKFAFWHYPLYADSSSSRGLLPRWRRQPPTRARVLQGEHSLQRPRSQLRAEVSAAR